MKTRRFTLDTNIVTALLKENEKALAKLREAWALGWDVTMNAISYYEIRRGLESTGREETAAAFDGICRGTGLLLIDERAVLDQASAIWARLKQEGTPIPDADVLMASIAMVKGYTLVSDDKHFERVPGLAIENWLR